MLFGEQTRAWAYGFEDHALRGAQWRHLADTTARSSTRAAAMQPYVKLL